MADATQTYEAPHVAIAILIVLANDVDHDQRPPGCEQAAHVCQQGRLVGGGGQVVHHKRGHDGVIGMRGRGAHKRADVGLGEVDGGGGEQRFQVGARGGELLGGGVHAVVVRD